ncbi:hypothetical protein VDGL01_00195 [Verticillium dahliae]
MGPVADTFSLPRPPSAILRAWPGEHEERSTI